MTQAGPRVTVAIVNTTPDAIDMLRHVFEAAGFVVVSCFTYDIREGQTDFASFVARRSCRSSIRTS